MLMRSPKTTAERRDADLAKREGVKVRPKRNARNLPNAWDEIIIDEPRWPVKPRGKRKSDLRPKETTNDPDRC